jgi:hypothetical protein
MIKYCGNCKSENIIEYNKYIEPNSQVCVRRMVCKSCGVESAWKMPEQWRGGANEGRNLRYSGV